jgi:hypothetical protein
VAPHGQARPSGEAPASEQRTPLGREEQEGGSAGIKQEGGSARSCG